MQLNKLLTPTLILLISIFFTACGGESSGNVTQDTAISKLEAYANSKATSDTPTVQDYIDAGVVGVTETNLANINELISNLTPSEVDTPPEVQAVVNTVEDVSLAPVAVATANKRHATQGQSIRFSAADSSDVDGNIVSYEWKEGSTVLHNISVFDKADFSVGVHTLTLTVTDDKGNTNSTTVRVTIKTKVIPAQNGEVVIAPIISGILDSDQNVTLTPQEVSQNREGFYAQYYSFTLVETSFVELYAYSGIIDCTAEDPYIYLIEGTERTGTVISFDDDNGESGGSQPLGHCWDSYIGVNLDPGDYLIEATSFAILEFSYILHAIVTPLP